VRTWTGARREPLRLIALAGEGAGEEEEPSEGERGHWAKAKARLVPARQMRGIPARST
jgi:hypothetical protein